MYTKVEGNKRLHENDATAEYPDSYILMRMDNVADFCQTGTVLYYGDDRMELFSLAMGLDDPRSCVVMEGVRLSSSLGGVVVHG
jgi:hypothetical protein